MAHVPCDVSSGSIVILTMKHYRSLDDVHLQDTWLTIGSFDGVHLGHQKIIQDLTAGAHSVGAPAVVLTFYPHPAVLLGRRKGPIYLTDPEEKASLLEQFGVDAMITHPFTRQVANTPARDFMLQLKDHLGLNQLWVGYDFALGHGRTGDVPALRRFGEELGYTLDVITAVKYNGQVVSSSLIRSTLAEGNVEKAAQLLGRRYSILGKVVPGDGRGRTIGIPTANFEVWAERILPRTGVYVCQAWVNGKPWGAVTNVGVRPTFENQPVLPRVEAHLLDFDQNLYGQEIHLDFIARLRDEQRFPSVQALIEQVHQDITRGRQILSNSES